MDAGGEGDAGHSQGLDIAALVHRYGRSFVHSNPDVALEYYMRVSSACVCYLTNEYVQKYLMPVQLSKHFAFRCYIKKPCEPVKLSCAIWHLSLRSCSKMFGATDGVHNPHVHMSALLLQRT